MIIILSILSASLFAFALIISLNRIASILSTLKEIPENITHKILENHLEVLRKTMNKLNYDSSIRELHHRILYLEGRSDQVPTMRKAKKGEIK